MRDCSIQKILVIGSGPIVIGQAAEFDYAGTQACRAIREEGVEVVLLNSNPATIMTDKDIADHVYIEPLTPEVLKKLILLEKPDAVLPTLGGQAGLNLAMALEEEGFLEKNHVRLAGTTAQTIRKAEDRLLFKETMEKIGEPVAASEVVHTVEEGLRAADEIGYPVVLRPAYTLGGSGGGIAENEAVCREILENGLRLSRVQEVLVERSIAGWKEIEYEVMRDAAGNVITVCNMENLDPVGIHTGDSIVVAPSQTLTDKEYQMLRTSALSIISELEITGGCNVQFALNPRSYEYCVIEVNPRVSRSSALASKATGYPIARVAAKIALGYTLDEIRNVVTGKTCACFEPMLDYCVVKMPRLPFDKFTTAEHRLGTQMKATGEVMAICGSFEGALMKAIRSLEQHVDSLLSYDYSGLDDAELRKALRQVDDRRIWVIAEALRRGCSTLELHRLTQIDLWFIGKLSHLVEMEQRLQNEPLVLEYHMNHTGAAPDAQADVSGGTDTGSQDHYVQRHVNYPLLLRAKQLGFPDAVIGRLAGMEEQQIRRIRRHAGIEAAFNMVDTCAAEFDAETPYFYSGYGVQDEARHLIDRENPDEIDGENPDVNQNESQVVNQTEHGSMMPSRRMNFREEPRRKKVLILGSGPIRIGQGIEFDFCSVHAAWAFKREGWETIIINNNPETVSTDFDISDRLYFEPLTPEDVRNVVELEHPDGAVVQFGGQTAIKLTESLMEMGVPVLGTQPDDVDAAEDRERFDKILQETGIRRPAGRTVYTAKEAKAAAAELGYPVLVRPSYVLGGQGMRIAISDDDIDAFIGAINQITQEHPILVDQYIQGKELEVDAICDGTDILIPGIMEHIERTGIHSGDSISVYPPRDLPDGVRETMIDYTRRLAAALHVKGMINIQFIAAGEEVYIIEVNPRSSRTVPYISKVTGIPVIPLAAGVICGHTIREMGYEPGLQTEARHFAIKMPVFSFEKIKGADIALGPEMKSTGECLGVSEKFHEALYKAFQGAGVRLPKYKNMVVTVCDEEKQEIIPIAGRFASLGYRIFATQGTFQALQEGGVPCLQVRKAEQESPNILDLVLGHELDLVIDIPNEGAQASRDGFAIRRVAVETGVNVITAVDTAGALVTSLENAEEDMSLTDIASISVTA
ncbi:MAG: carbamoyl-phosphate synthase large subunit [Eubacterium sp.]|nr:carbamoyl-phosphate synthase large subunit [Eubacterium sp.]